MEAGSFTYAIIYKSHLLPCVQYQIIKTHGTVQHIFYFTVFVSIVISSYFTGISMDSAFSPSTLTVSTDIPGS